MSDLPRAEAKAKAEMMPVLSSSQLSTYEISIQNRSSMGIPVLCHLVL
jgi:hypothetical protein